MTQPICSRTGVAGLALGILLTGAPAAVAVDRVDRLDADLTVSDGSGEPVALAEVDANRPLALHPDRGVVLDLRITNPQDEAVVLRTVRLEGRVLGMTFFDYATRVDRPVEPGATVELSLPLDVSELGEQATGLLPARITLIGEDREVLAEDPFPVDVKGSLWSTYGVFGLLVATVTLVLLAAALVRLALGALPRHRWLRASRFAVPGLGLGLTLTFTLSVLGVLVPSADSWVATVVGGGVLGLVAGWSTPSPDSSRRRRPVTPRETEHTRERPTTYQQAAAQPLEAERDEDRTIVLPDDVRPVPGTPVPRAPRDADARPGTDPGLPPRPARRR